MIFTVVIEDLPGDDTRVRAHWFGLHHSNGATVISDNPITALRDLAKQLEKEDERQAMINEIDAGDDE